MTDVTVKEEKEGRAAPERDRLVFIASQVTQSLSIPPQWQP